LGYTGLLLFLISFIPSTRGALDINMHDTYFVIADVSLCSVFSGFLLFLWAINMLVRRIIYSLTLSWFYVVFTLIPIALFLILPLMHRSFEGPPRKYYAFDEFEKMKSAYNINTTYACTFVALVIGQLLLMINILIGLGKGIHRTAKVS